METKVTFTRWFLTLLAQRMFAGTGTVGTPSVGLGRADAPGLNNLATLEDMQELQQADNPGYSRATGTWSVTIEGILSPDNESPGPIATVNAPGTAFANSGQQDWQEARNVFVLLGGELAFFAPVTPFVLQPDQTAGFELDTIPVRWRRRSNA